MIKKILLVAFIAFGSLAMVAQTTVTGIVKDAKTGELFLEQTLKLRKSCRYNTDFDGKFVLKVTDNHLLH